MKIYPETQEFKKSVPSIEENAYSNGFLINLKSLKANVLSCLFCSVLLTDGSPSNI